ncbi:MAG: hypothetical protein ACXV5Q_12605 [Frankiaceae bacterium]
MEIITRLVDGLVRGSGRLNRGVVDGLGDLVRAAFNELAAFDEAGASDICSWSDSHCRFMGNESSPGFATRLT